MMAPGPRGLCLTLTPKTDTQRRKTEANELASFCGGGQGPLDAPEKLSTGTTKPYAFTRLLGGCTFRAHRG